MFRGELQQDRQRVNPSLTRSQRRRRIGVQPISSSVATVPTFHNTSTRNDTPAADISAVPLPLLCEARLNNK